MSFPRLYARTRGFTLGRPRSFLVAPDGSRVLFLRSAGPEDPVTDLWCYDVTDGRERRLVRAADLLGGDDEALSPEERARRERARESSQGIVAYACDRDVAVAAFVLGGRLFSIDVASATLEEHDSVRGAFDPRPSPDGSAIAYESGGEVHVVERGGGTRRIAGEPTPDVTWGRAEFVAAEEMGRGRGFWWSPDGASLAVTRVDERNVGVWYLADPARPEQPPQAHRYPAAGTNNAVVSLHVVASRDGAPRADVDWDRSAFPYLARVQWDEHGLALLVQSRDQRRWRLLRAGTDGRTDLLREDVDEVWLDLVGGTPGWLADGRAVVVVPTDRGEGGTNSLVVGDTPVTPPGLQVRAVIAVDDDAVTFTAAGDDPTQIQAWRWTVQDGAQRLTPDLDGVSTAATGGATTVVVRETATSAPDVVVRSAAGEHRLTTTTMPSPVEPRVEYLDLGPRRLRGALLRPSQDDGGDLPVLLDPYGGPHGERVIRSRNRFLVSQWFADQGFAVLVVDGRGMPNRGPRWERAVRGDLATPVLEDQIDALRAASEVEPRLDLERVGIRGWSFGGFLAALAVLRRPDVFRAAVAGAPVTDWRLYDTHYTERYLGLPASDPDAYRRSSLVDAEVELLEAAPLEGRPAPELLLIHGLVDDNVVAAHTLRLSHALLAAGRPHRLLALSGVTHMTPQEVVAENLLLLQRDFLRAALA